ncbi:MAG: carboxypeptidase-like regulatory domain-containing protein, partial [Nitrospirota bacterium]
MPRPCALLIRWSVAALAIAVPLKAQEITGSVFGSVTDPSGAPIAAAQMRVSGPELVRAQSARTGSDGTFQFPALPPGVYELRVTAAGFAAGAQQETLVAIGRATRVDFKLNIASESNSVTVNGEVASIDVRHSAVAENVPGSMSDRLPRLRSFDSLIDITPGVRAEVKSGQYQVDGASGSENAFIIEGVETNDIYSGLLLQNGQVPFEFVQEFRIQSSGFEAQYPAATGGVVTVVLRSGGNQFHGSGFLYAESSVLNAGPRSFLTLDPIDDNRSLRVNPGHDGLLIRNPSLTLGGPVLKDRIWFYGGFSPQ